MLSEVSRLIVHCCHHRVGTLWFKTVLGSCAETFGLKFFEGEQSELPGDAAIFLQNHSKIRVRELPPLRGTHLIRDPRDVVVSGYYYHLSCEEEWCLVPQRRFGGRSYQDVLRTLGHDDGIEFEMRYAAAATFREMASWNYGDPRFLELKYEDLIADEARVFARIFEHYGFGAQEQRRALEIALSKSFERVTNRPVGVSEDGHHLRRGLPGQWREEFTAKHVALSEQLFGKGLVRLGYPLH